MNYKELWDICVRLLTAPRKAWESIALQTNRKSVHTNFVYPMIGLCALAVFVGVLLTSSCEWPLSVQVAMKQCCAVAVSQFGGYFLAAYAIDRMGARLFGLPANQALIQQYAGYSLVVMFLLQIVTGLLPDLKIIAWVLQFYTFYIIWEGIPSMVNPPGNQRLRYVILFGAILLLCPVGIQKLFNQLTTLLN